MINSSVKAPISMCFGGGIAATVAHARAMDDMDSVAASATKAPLMSSLMSPESAVR